MNDSPFMPAEVLPKRAKIMLQGDFGTGKTTLGLKFPRPVLLDMDAGSDLYADRSDFDVLRATDADSAMNAANWLLTNKHPYRTLIVDPVTIYWDALQRKWNEIFLNRNKGGKGHKFEFYEFQPRDWMTLKAEHKEFLRRLSMLDMTVIVTAREKVMLSDDGNFRKIGETFDGEKTLPYFFDTVIRLFKRGDAYMARALKDRTGRLPTGEFPNDYAVFSEAFGDILTNEVVQDPPASEEQKDNIKVMSGILMLDDERMMAGLRHYAKCEGWDDLTEGGAAKVLAALSTRIKSESKKEKSDAAR